MDYIHLSRYISIRGPRIAENPPDASVCSESEAVHMPLRGSEEPASGSVALSTSAGLWTRIWHGFCTSLCSANSLFCIRNVI